MGNIISYIKWRGDLSFEERPFCDIDNLVFSQLSYLHLKGIVPRVGEQGDIKISWAMELFLKSSETLGNVSPAMLEFAEALKNSRRFGQLTLCNHTDLANIEESDTDFSAIQINLSEDCAYIAFRGTGGSLIGWKEDLSMSYSIMPAQHYAERFLEDVYQESISRYYLGGHSKGGNLALYAAAAAKKEIQDKIAVIYSNDGPGLCEEIVPGEKVDAVRDRLVRIVPDFSVVGAIFETEGARTIIVKSSREGVAAHDALSWQIEGDSFCTCEKHSNDSLFYNDVIKKWVESADMEDRESFTEDLFEALEATGAKTLSDLSGHGADDFFVVLLSVIRADDRSRSVVYRFGQTFVSALRHVKMETLTRDMEVILALVLFVLGIAISMNPAVAVRLVGMVLGVAGAVYLGKRAMDTAFSETGTTDARKMKMAVDLVAMCFLMYLVAEKNILMALSNLIIGACFLIFAYHWLQRTLGYKIIYKRVIGLIISLLAFTAGMLPLIVNGLVINTYMITVGTFMWLYGVGMFVYRAYKNGKENLSIETTYYE